LKCRLWVKGIHQARSAASLGTALMSAPQR